MSFPVVSIERHALGPRLRVLGRRVHEWHAGLGAAIAAAGAALLGLGAAPVAALAVLAVWLVAKDWHDLRPTTRDTTAWRLGIHRVPGTEPAGSAGARVPVVAAAMTAVVGAINVASAMTSELPARVQALLALAPAGEVRLAHAVALPAGLALIAAAWPLARRRRRAVAAAIALLALLGAADLAKGLDVEEAAVSWALAAVLWRARSAFWVRHRAGEARRIAARAAVACAATFATAVLAVGAAAGHAASGLSLSGVPGAAASLLTLTGGPRFHAPFGWLAAGLGILGAGTAAYVGALVLAPLRPSSIAGALDRRRTAALVRRHGTDTLSAFKLRDDLFRHWSADGRAVVAYRPEAGTMLIAGDPVGPPEVTATALQSARAFARERGLRVAALGASESFAAAAERAGMRRIYLGDEALLGTGALDLSGGRHKSLRKAVGRIRRHGYEAVLVRAGGLDPRTRREMEEVSERWRAGAPERGFSMAHDALVDELLPDAAIVFARDGEGRVRGFLHFVPVFGRDVMSLGFMRRDRDTPNGLNDFLVVEAARLLAEEGVAELSLNFCAFGRWLRDPQNRAERVLARLLRLGDRFFQVERLLRFNAKFDPRWQPRYLLLERYAQGPAVALAAMWAEGQLPRPALPRPAAWRRPPVTAPAAG